MSFAQDNGYTPVSFEALMSFVREGINEEFGTTYTEESFVGTGWYKYFYSLIQKIQENEVKTSEIFLKLQEYIESTNERIQRPSVSYPGLIEAFESEGFLISLKRPAEEDAGKVFVCVDLDTEAVEYLDNRDTVFQLLKEFVPAGMVFIGDETDSLTLSNGQSFDFKFQLPEEIPIWFRITLNESANNMIAVPEDVAIREALFANFAARYRIGWDLEPQKYFTLADALWASNLLLEWSDDEGDNWYDTVVAAEYTDKFTLELENIEVIFE